jgi:hypothetical protein
MTPNIIYLHGFASSPASTKAQDFAQRFAQLGITLRIPDLNVPDFEHLTLTAMLRRVAEEVRACPSGPVYLMGSSMGGLTALHFVDVFRGTEGARVSRMLLMAPAFDFIDNRKRQDADLLEQWHTHGEMAFYNYAHQREMQVHYGLIDDLATYDSFSVPLDIPVLIFHGRHDASVDFDQSVRFADGRPNVDLRLVDSDHQLVDQMDVMWQATLDFFLILTKTHKNT